MLNGPPNELNETPAAITKWWLWMKHASHECKMSVATSDWIPSFALKLFCCDGDKDAVRAALDNEGLSADCLGELAGHSSPELRRWVAEHERVPSSALRLLASDCDSAIAKAAIERLAVSDEPADRMAAVRENTPRHLLQTLSIDTHSGVREAARAVLEAQDQAQRALVLSSLSDTNVSEVLREHDESGSASEPAAMEGLWDAPLEDIFEMYDIEEAAEWEPSDDIERRAMVAAQEIVERHSWHGGFDVLVRALSQPRVGKLKVSIERQISAGLTPEQLEVALDVREYLRNYLASERHVRMSWDDTIRLIDAFEGYPSFEEVAVFIERCYEEYSRVPRRTHNSSFSYYMWRLLQPHGHRVPGNFDLLYLDMLRS